MTHNDIDWPVGFSRTHPRERVDTAKFDTSRRDTVEDILHELDLLGADNVRVQTAAEHQQRNHNIPYADATADDPRAVVRWQMDDAGYAVACDQYTDLRDNLRAIYLYINEKRKMDDRPVVTGEDEFATARLPPADDGHVVAAEQPAHAILGVDPDADEFTVRAAYKEKVQELHPDKGGTSEEFQRLQSAREEVLDG